MPSGKKSAILNKKNVFNGYMFLKALHVFQTWLEKETVIHACSMCVSLFLCVGFPHFDWSCSSTVERGFQEEISTLPVDHLRAMYKVKHLCISNQNNWMSFLTNNWKKKKCIVPWSYFKRVVANCTRAILTVRTNYLYLNFKTCRLIWLFIPH